MKILVISGFLGAGKTTFIRELVRRSRREIAVFENEYGSVGVDAGVLKSSAETKMVNIWEMAEGCICCSMRGDFAASVLTIANTVDPDYLVIEPTGVGKLSNVMDSLNRITYERIRLLKPLTLVDGFSFERYRSEYAELYLDQIRRASYLAITKMEGASASEIKHLSEALKRLNPSAKLCASHYKTAPEAWWEQLLEETGGSPEVQDAGAGLLSSCAALPDTFSMEEAYVNAPEHLLIFLEMLIRGHFGNIIRAKGAVSAGSCRMRFDVADGRYSVTVEELGSSEEKEGETAVFIGNRIARQAIRRIVFQKNIVQRGKIKIRPVVPHIQRFSKNSMV